MKRNNIRVAIQKGGRLKNECLKLLESRGLQCGRGNERAIIVPCVDADVEILYVRHSDIPEYVQSGAADFGIVGRNVLYEGDFNVEVIEELSFGQCSLVIAVPVDSDIQDVAGLEGERIATSYPNSLRKLLSQAKINAAIVEIAGSVEAAPALGLADAICDLTQTGNTLKANGLRQIAVVLSSRAVLIESPITSEQKNVFKEKLMETTQ